jgi:hypothetical protein
LLGARARPQAPAFGDDAHPDLWTKAGALLQSIVRNHDEVADTAARLRSTVEG